MEDKNLKPPSNINLALLKRQLAEARQHQIKAETALKNVMNLSFDLIFTLDQEYTFRTVSASANKLLKYLADELIGQSLLDIVHLEDKPKTHQFIARLREDKIINPFETRLLHHDGTCSFFLLSGTWDAKENLGYLIGRDIAGLKEKEEKIENNEKRLQAIFQNSNDGLTLLAADGTALERSSSSKRILGKCASETADKFQKDLIHPDDMLLVDETFKKVVENPGYSQIIEYRIKSGVSTYKWLKVTFHNQLQNPFVKAIILNYRDITADKQAKTELQRSEILLKEAMAIGKIGYWEYNVLEGKIIWSDGFYNLLGIKKGEASPSIETYIDFIHPEDKQNFFSRWDMENHIYDTRPTNYRIVRKNGEIRYATTIYRIEYDKVQKPTRFFGIVQDITDRHLMELALAKSKLNYRDLFNYIPIPMFIYDIESLKFLEVNEAMINHYGFSKTKFLKMTLYDIMPLETIPELEEKINDMKKTATKCFLTTRHKKKNEKIIDVNVQSRVFQLGDREAGLALAVDISEQLQHINSIKEQNENLKEIAWMQSHLVRAPLARIMGLVNLLEEDPENNELFPHIKRSTTELDTIIREIVHKTEKLKK